MRPQFIHPDIASAYRCVILKPMEIGNMNRILAIVGVACIAASAQAQTGKLFVGEYGYDQNNVPFCYETTLGSGFPASVSWAPTFQFFVQGAACTPQNIIYLTTGTFSTDLYMTIPGRVPSRVAATSQTIFDMGYVNGHLYGWAEYATPSGIYEINPQTGACTLAVASTSELFFALDGNPADGLLYGFTEYGVTGLYSINPTTGVKHRIAPPPPVATFPNSYGSCRGLAVGNNTVYLTNTWNGRDPSDPDRTLPDSYYAYNLAQGDNGVYVQFTNPYSATTPQGGGSFWYDPSVIPAIPGPTNDHCANATPIGEGTFAFDTTWADTDGVSACGGVSDVWFLYTPTYSHYALITTCGTLNANFDTVMSVYATSCGGTEIDCNDDSSCGLQSTVGYHVSAGVPVLVRVSGYDEAARGPGLLTIGECPGINIDSQPLSRTITRCTATASSSGADFFVRFTANASGRDDITYAWERNGVPLSDTGSGSLDEYGMYNTHGWSMIIVRPTRADAGAYRCVLSSIGCDNPLTVNTNVATLTFCAADYNCSHSLSVQDIFDFLAAWFAGNAGADINGVNGITVQDIFDFLGAWFAGCP
jgi:hypothetical protein